MKNYLGAAILAVSIVVLGLCIKSGIDNFAFRDRIVTVRGLAERIVDADRVTWRISYSIAGNDLSEMYEGLTASNNTVLKFLTDNGISRDDISVNPYDLYNAEGNIYNYAENVKYRYKLNSSITVATANVAKVRELLNRQSELFKLGVAVENGYNSVYYEYTGLNTIKPDMITEATRNAREAADRFALDSNSRVGKIKTATQGQFSIESSDESTPHKKKVRVVSTVEYYLED